MFLTRLVLAILSILPSSNAAFPPMPSVLQHHGRMDRTGFYLDPAMTPENVRALAQDPSFQPEANGTIYGQPLYLVGAAGKRDLVLVATERNEVSAFDAKSGDRVWNRSLGDPMPRKKLKCGNIDPLGITGSPAIDPQSRTLYVDAALRVEGEKEDDMKHLIYALSVDDGEIRQGWPVDVGAILHGLGRKFNAIDQNQRGALSIIGGSLYVPFGGHFGDCGEYHGWIVRIPLSAPSHVGFWATRGMGGGVWAPGGISSDGTSLFFATGNTLASPEWRDGQAVIRLPLDLQYRAEPRDYFSPADWKALDDTDLDLGSITPIPFEIREARPSRLLITLAKNGMAYLLNRANFGGIGHELARARVADEPIRAAPALYEFGGNTYFVFSGKGVGCPGGKGGSLTALRITHEAHPRISVAWCAIPQGRVSPPVVAAAPGTAPIVFAVGGERDHRLRAWDGITGKPIFEGEIPDQMQDIHRLQPPIIARGRLLFAAGDRIYAFRVKH